MAFFDATFALALTLLVTTLDVGGKASAWDSLSSLDDEVGSQFIAFGISFAVISNFWLAHHRMVASFAAIDPPIMVANLFLIASIVVIPFTTEAVGNPATADLELPVAVFALNVTMASIFLILVYWLAWRRELFSSRPTLTEFRRNLIAGIGPPAVFLVSIPIAYLVSPDVAKLSWLSLVPLGVLTRPRGASGGEPG